MQIATGTWWSAGRIASALVIIASGIAAAPQPASAFDLKTLSSADIRCAAGTVAGCEVLRGPD